MSQLTAEQRAAQMQEAIDNAQRALEEGERFFEANGLNRDKAMAYLESQLTEQTRAQALAAVQADLEEVERDVQARAGQLSLSSVTSVGSNAAIRRRRQMI